MPNVIFRRERYDNIDIGEKEWNQKDLHSDVPCIYFYFQMAKY
jgi:hypothetical protein